MSDRLAVALGGVVMALAAGLAIFGCFQLPWPWWLCLMPGMPVEAVILGFVYGWAMRRQYRHGQHYPGRGMDRLRGGLRDRVRRDDDLTAGLTRWERDYYRSRR
jgi:hypothetical protein